MSFLFGMFLISVVLILAAGIFSLIVTRNLMRILISIELLTKAVTLLLLCAGHMIGDMATAQSYVVTVIIIEVVLIAIATGIVLGAFRVNNTLDSNKLNNLKG